jgi:thymidylate synthase (FAD)
MKIIESSVTIINPELISDAMVCKRLERIARTCYQSEDKINEASYRPFVKKLLKAKHFSIFEHEQISVSIITSRAIANQLVRHRLASYAQESTRYVKYNDLEVIYDDFNLNTKQAELMLESMQVVESLYLNLLHAGIMPQFARNILPIATKTEIVVTANIRAWMHILATRLSHGAHPEMIQIMETVLDEFIILMPTIFGSFEEWKDYV